MDAVASSKRSVVAKMKYKVVSELAFRSVLAMPSLSYGYLFFSKIKAKLYSNVECKKCSAGYLARIEIKANSFDQHDCLDSNSC